jgi:hypothetical protein
MNKYAEYGTVIMTASVYAITDLHHPHAHVEQIYNTDPIQMGRLIYAVTTSSVSSSQMPLIINRPARR